MNEEGKFWVAVWTVATVAVVSIIAAVVIYNIDYNAKIVKMVQTGVSPVEAVCGLSDSFGDNPTCIIIALKEVK